MPKLMLNEKGLIPAIAQDVDTGTVLMLGYMSPESIKRTLETGDVWFYSRSRANLWHKGEISGNYLRVRSVEMDCDGDVILVKVRPEGPACHTGSTTCFFKVIDELPGFTNKETGSGILEELFATIQDRKNAMPNESYTAQLFKNGVERISQKIIEEAGEVAIAGIKQDREHVAQELADLIYHTLVLISAIDAKPEDFYAKLRERRQ